MWRELGYFMPFVILVWPTRPPSAYSGSMMIGRKLDSGENDSFHSLHTGCFSCCEKEKQILLKIITLTTKFSSKAFHQCENWLNKVSCWNTKIPCLIFFNELRASSLQFKRFIQKSLRCSFFGIRNDKVLFSFTKRIVLEYKLKLSKFDRLLLHEFFVQITLTDFGQKSRQLRQLISFLTFVLMKL